jgi:hypothetical protein
MFRATGRGKYDYKKNGPNDWTVNLYNFDVEGDQLKHDHTNFLDASIVPLLKAGGGVTIMGIADATGDLAYNQALSERRANVLLAFLRREAGGAFPVSRTVGRGKSFAVRIGGRDHFENEYYRAVALRVWEKATPPPPPPYTPTFDLDRMPDATAGDIFNPASVVEGVGSTILSLIDIFTEVYWIGIAATFYAPAVDIAFTVLSMFFTFKRTRELARVNGWCSGFAQAMADMAYAYRDPNLDITKSSTWPTLPKPTPHLEYNVADSQLEGFNQQQRLGLREGCDKAYDTIRQLDLHPRPATATYNGKIVNYMMTGKIMLGGLYRARKGAVFAATMEQINRKLRERGKGEWPITD